MNSDKNGKQLRNNSKIAFNSPTWGSGKGIIIQTDKNSKYCDVGIEGTTSVVTMDCIHVERIK